MLVASFTSRIPTMGEKFAHLKFCELLETHRLLTYFIKGNQQPNI